MSQSLGGKGCLHLLSEVIQSSFVCTLDFTEQTSFQCSSSRDENFVLLQRILDCDEAKLLPASGGQEGAGPLGVDGDRLGGVHVGEDGDRGLEVGGGQRLGHDGHCGAGQGGQTVQVDLEILA